MKSAIKGIVGKRISGVIVKENESRPGEQVFLLFDDNTYYETYADGPLGMAGGIDKGGAAEVRNYMSNRKIVLEALSGSK